MRVISEYRALGDPWPEAIRSSRGIKARFGRAMWNVGKAICRTGGKLDGFY